MRNNIIVPSLDSLNICDWHFYMSTLSCCFETLSSVWNPRVLKSFRSGTGAAKI